MARTIFMLILLASSTLGLSQTYKWRDASGNMQYSDMPPPPGAKDVRQLRGAAPAPQAPSSASAAKSVADQDAEFRKRLASKQEAEGKQVKAEEEEKARARNCELARSQLAALESGARMVKLDSKGERLALDDAEREQARMEAKKAVDTWCK